MITITINPASLRRLEKLPEQERKVVQMTLQRTALEVQNQAKSAPPTGAPYKTGTLRRSITMEPQNVPLGASEVIVGTNLPYAPIQNYGGTIKPKNRKFLSWVSPGGIRIFAKSVYIKGNQYMTRAYERAKGMVQDIFNQEFERYINK